jgi:hypothetical protein
VFAAGAQGHPGACGELAVNKRRSGNHKTKGISDIAAPPRSPTRRRARATRVRAAWASPQPAAALASRAGRARSHETELPKKVRKLALKTALEQAGDGRLIVIDEAKIKTAKTKDRPRSSASPAGLGADHRRSDGRRGFLRAGSIFPMTRPAAAGRQRLRHPAARHLDLDHDAAAPEARLKYKVADRGRQSGPCTI